MKRELKTEFNLYLTLKDGETEQEVLDRLYAILFKAERQNCGFTISEMYDYEIQEY